MNTKNSPNIFSAVLIIGMLAALPVYAGSGLIKVTHSDTPYHSRRDVAPNCAVAGSRTVKTNSTEVQIAVMAKSPIYSGPRRSMFIHR